MLSYRLKENNIFFYLVEPAEPFIPRQYEPDYGTVSVLEGMIIILLPVAINFQNCLVEWERVCWHLGHGGEQVYQEPRQWPSTCSIAVANYQGHTHILK